MHQITKFIQPFPQTDYGEQPIGLDEQNAQTWVYSLMKEFRLYQFTILQSTFYYNTLVCLPTGLGKTFIASMAILNFSKWFPSGKIFFLAPTRPLVVQQQEAMKQFGIDGKLTKQDRTYQSQIYFSTPQTLDNDLNPELIDQIVLVVLDEAHKGVGDYAYTAIVKRLSYKTRIIALSATPGNNLEQIQEVVANLRIAKIELKDENDPEVIPYLKFKGIEKIIVSFDNCSVLDDLNKKIQPLLNLILKYEILPVELIRVCSRAEIFSFGSCYKMREYLKNAQLQIKIGNQHAKIIFDHLHHLHKLAYAKKLLLEQGIQPYAKYMEQEEVEEIHPKIEKLKEIFRNHFSMNESKVIVFTNSRDNAQLLCNHINQVENVRASIFVGQANSKNQAGMKQKEQLEVINKFKTELNVLVATCIAEEGLDIGEVDLIICYDSGFSPIRMIQRMGRTGRKRDGKIIILLTEGKEVADYEKSVNKYSKLISELKDTNLNFYSCNPRILSSRPELQFIDGDISKIQIKIFDQDSNSTKTKLIKKKKGESDRKNQKNQMNIEKFFQKPQEIVIEQNKQNQQLLLLPEIVQKTKPKKEQKIKFTKLDNFFKKKEQNEPQVESFEKQNSNLQYILDEEISYVGETVENPWNEIINVKNIQQDNTIRMIDLKKDSVEDLDLSSIDLKSSCSNHQISMDVLNDILNTSDIADIYKSDNDEQ